MAQESRLAVTIDSRGAKRNADDLTDSLKGMERAGEGATSSTEGLSSSLDEQRKELSQLLGQINPTVSALGRLDDMQEKLAKFKKAGIVESDTFVEYSDRINVMRNALGETADGMNATGMSAKQMQNNLRMLPAQFTDIAVSLQSGQAPLTVLLQQGGQLKDMFGGIGPAARAMGGYIAGLVNPFTLAAAVAGALAVAYYQGSEESERFANALIENGNAAGTSANQLADLANQVASTGTTVGAASGVLTQLAAAGNPLTSMYAEITQASLAWSKQTGRDVTEVVKSFNDIAKNPVEAIKKLDGELNILTASQYANIVSLQEQGKTMDAARMAAALYLEEINGRSAKIKENLGDIENLWNGIAGAAAKAWDSMLAVGRDQTLEDQIANTEKILAGRKQGFLSSLFSEDDASTKFLETKLTQLQNALAANTAKAAADANNKAIQDAGKKASDTINATYKAGQSQTEKLQSQLKDLDKARAASLAAGSFSAEQEVKYAGARKNIEQQIADIKEREAKKSKPKAAKENNRGVSEAENTFAKLYNQYDPAAQAARALTKEQGQLQLVLDKGKISQEEYGKALAQSSINYAAAIKGASGLTAAEQYRAQVQKRLANEQEGYRVEAASVGMGDLQADRYRQRVQLERQMNDEIIGLQDNLRLAENASQRAAIQEQIKILEETNPARLEALQKGWAQMDQAMLNPINGWTAAVQNFGNQARDIAGQTQSIFSSAFNTISTDITSAIMDGTLSFSTLGDIGKAVLQQILAGFIKMGVQMAMNAALSATIGASTTTANIALAGTTASAWAPAAAMVSLATLGTNAAPANAALISTTGVASGLAVVPGFATGGYISGPGSGTSDSIPARLSNGEFVVNAQATKRNRSLLEAINSNERVSVRGDGGSLTVQSGGTSDSGRQSGGSGGGLSIPIQVTVQAQPGMSDAEARRQGQLAGEGVRDIVRQVIQDEQRPGGMLS
ncbi:tail length tape measure protein [Pseudomonas sp. HLS-6]|uniref:phage tail length tape measure family protein n=1 Tax=Pseudomonas sp. HLS-6 TaxID=2049589 RepID=UPI000C1A757A|nr:phage tail length tape measure family protein [Pseudomonas sp. HLS-6]ATR82789.1 tail length tape measure protein [Pseudomonas sp. HLS-6]